MSRRQPPSGARERGFTLIEVLVVIIVLGILAAIAIPAFLNQRRKAVDASLKADLKALAFTYEAAFQQNGPGPWPSNRVPTCVDVFTPNPDGQVWTTGWQNGRTDSLTGLDCTDGIPSWKASPGNSITDLVVRSTGYCLTIRRNPWESPATRSYLPYASNDGGLLQGTDNCGAWAGRNPT